MRTERAALKTSILPVDVHNIGDISAIPQEDDILDSFRLDLRPDDSREVRNLKLAAEQLRESEIPVAFPTETVYGLGADATRSAAVNGIYKAKQRPSDNPLIVHFASLKQLRELLRPEQQGNGQPNGRDTLDNDPIPAIYRPLISKFWPGPLTIILPNPKESPLAPEVTAGLKTFGARIPRHALALALIQLSNKPIAAPSANASTKPSPTAAEHVAHDLDGRIEIIIDGGPCDVGVESTVVDGLSRPPRILRPGGVSLEQLKLCAGWEDTQVAYMNVAETDLTPTAPGMKYRHYSPRASVLLHEVGTHPPDLIQLRDTLGLDGNTGKVGIITTRHWAVSEGIVTTRSGTPKEDTNGIDSTIHASSKGFVGMLEMLQKSPSARQAVQTHEGSLGTGQCQLLTIALGSNVADIARGVFSALRELDREHVDAIIVEGIDDNEGDTAAAVMNRLRKAAEVKVRE